MDEWDEQTTWSMNADHVQRVLKFIRKRGKQGVTPEEIVAWDAAHGKRLFCWTDREAAAQWRLHQARMFLNCFRGVIDRMRVRQFINVPAGEETGLSERIYLDTQVISDDAKLRAWAIADLTRKAKVLMSELRFWKLSDAERAQVLDQLSEALTAHQSAA